MDKVGNAIGAALLGGIVAFVVIGLVGSFVLRWTGAPLAVLAGAGAVGFGWLCASVKVLRIFFSGILQFIVSLHG